MFSGWLSKIEALEWVVPLRFLVLSDRNGKCLTRGSFPRLVGSISDHLGGSILANSELG
jgi:hypothetical protein